MEMVRTEFDVVLVSYGSDRREAIRKTMSIKGWGMQQAIGFLEKLPTVFCEGMDMYHAQALRAELEKIGCTVRIE